MSIPPAASRQPYDREYEDWLYKTKPDDGESASQQTTDPESSRMTVEEALSILDGAPLEERPSILSRL